MHTYTAHSHPRFAIAGGIESWADLDDESPGCHSSILREKAVANGHATVGDEHRSLDQGDAGVHNGQLLPRTAHESVARALCSDFGKQCADHMWLHMYNEVQFMVSYMCDMPVGADFIMCATPENHL